MPAYDDSEFRKNLKRIKNWTDEAILTGLEVAADKVITHIKTKPGHLWAKSLDPLTVSQHPHKEFYVHTQKLLNSLYVGENNSGRAKGILGGAQIEMGAQEPYASVVERGGAGRRAFPYMLPGMEAEREGNLKIMAEAVKKVLS